MKQMHFSTIQSFQEFIQNYLLLNPYLICQQHIRDDKNFYIIGSKNLKNATDQILEKNLKAEIYINDLSTGYLYIVSTYFTPALDDLCDKEELRKYFTSQSSCMEQVFNILKKVAKTSFPVLVRGESGAGKERVAQLIHQFGKRSNNPFISINCASLNANILESELFGHVKGAFTGAIRDHKGVFERANHGTLFLDEIAELPLDLQAKLLRVLETGEFTPLGGEKTIITDVRIVTATHRALREETKQGRFRYDLLYRLRVIPIFVPPLRERKSDIFLLADKIISEYAKEYPTRPSIDSKVMNIFEIYDWPGNIRELKNTLLYALTMAYGNNTITLQDLPQELISEYSRYISHNQGQNTEGKNFSRETLKAELEANKYDLNATQEKFKISRSTLWRYRKKWGI